jgi:hypothetical protein
LWLGFWQLRTCLPRSPRLPVAVGGDAVAGAEAVAARTRHERFWDSGRLRT